MTSKLNTEELKTKLGEYTEKAEDGISTAFIVGHSYYNELDSWKRGLILISLALFLLFVIYQLTTKAKTGPRELTDEERKQLEVRAEERILKRTEFLRRLQK